MPSINDAGTVELIAGLFCSNGRNKEKALLDAEYRPSYARSKGMKLYENERLIAAIARIDAKMQAKSEYTKEKAHELLVDHRERCIIAKDRTNELGSIKEDNTIFGLHKIDKEPALVINQNLISDVERKAILAKELSLLEAIDAEPLAIDGG